MKTQWSFRKSIILAATLAIVSGTAYAACRPNTCAQQRDACFENGGQRCEIKYYQCLRMHGCPIP